MLVLEMLMKVNELKERETRISRQAKALQKNLDVLTFISSTENVEDILSNEEMNKIMICADILNDLSLDCYSNMNTVGDELDQIQSLIDKIKETV